MGSIDLQQLERQARRRYERARLGQSLLGTLPVLALIGLSAAFARRPSSVVLFGTLLTVATLVFLWRGQSLRRAVVPGVLAGLIPLTFALVANFGHGCASGHCTTYCVQACTAGGVIAGLGVSFVAHRMKLGLGFWVATSALAVLTGAMGCSCVGYSGVLALLAGFAAGALPQVLRRVVA